MARATAAVRSRVDVRSRPVVSAAIAALVLMLGYADLWRGGVTVAPILLTIGYMVLVPIAVLAVPRGNA